MAALMFFPRSLLCVGWMSSMASGELLLYSMGVSVGSIVPASGVVGLFRTSSIR